MELIELANKAMREHTLAMALAQAEERTRCIRILSRWAKFCAAQNAPEVRAVLAKVAVEINAGAEPEDAGVAFGDARGH
jgi:hypothetical protein